MPTLQGEVSDAGPSEYASGEPALNDEGEIVSYTLQEGDTPYAIAERFCIDRPSLMEYNKVDMWNMQPGDVLVIRP